MGSFWQKGGLPQQTMTLLQGPKDPFLPTLMYIFLAQMWYHDEVGNLQNVKCARMNSNLHGWMESEWMYQKNKFTLPPEDVKGKIVDSSGQVLGLKNQRTVVLEDPNDSPSQDWVRGTGDMFEGFTLKHVSTGQYLTAESFEYTDASISGKSEIFSIYGNL